MKDLSDRKLANFIKKGRLSHEKSMDRIVYHNSVNMRRLYHLSLSFPVYIVSRILVAFSRLLLSVVDFGKRLQRCAVQSIHPAAIKVHILYDLIP